MDDSFRLVFVEIFVYHTSYHLRSQSTEYNTCVFGKNTIRTLKMEKEGV